MNVPSVADLLQLAFGAQVLLLIFRTVLFQRVSSVAYCNTGKYALFYTILKYSSPPEMVSVFPFDWPLCNKFGVPKKTSR